MLNTLRAAFSLFKYRVESGDAHTIHSPFVFQLYTQVICKRLHLAAYEAIELQRRKWQANKTEITITDFGAGSAVSSARKRNISSIAKHTLKPARFGQLLHRLVLHFEPETILELGTSLGITTAYLASGNKKADVITFEGCPQVSALARQTFRNLHLNNITQVQGNMDTTLPATLANLPKIDLAFFDGNHRLEPTLRYFTQCLEKAHEDSVFIIDDINWSPEMKQAWQQIKNHPRVRVTIDLHFIGLVFFRTQQPKQHFVLKF